MVSDLEAIRRSTVVVTIYCFKIQSCCALEQSRSIIAYDVAPSSSKALGRAILHDLDMPDI